MTRDDVIAKLISVRHHCFVRGVLGHGDSRIGGDDAFRQAFRTVNRAYVVAVAGERTSNGVIGRRRKSS